MNSVNIIQIITIWALPVIFAITLHEAAHGYVARHFGDMTAYEAGRISLNPLRHIDPMGTVVVPLVTLLLTVSFGGILFGWAKPVPVNFGRLRRPKQDMLWVAAAGPGINFIMALFWAIMIKIAPALPGNFATPLMMMGAAGIQINVVLMVLNLLPLPPLDGGRIAVSLLPSRAAMRFSRIEPYGIVILLILLITGILNFVLFPVIHLVSRLIAALFGVSL